MILGPFEKNHCLGRTLYQVKLYLEKFTSVLPAKKDRLSQKKAPYSTYDPRSLPGPWKSSILPSSQWETIVGQVKNKKSHLDWGALCEVNYLRRYVSSAWLQPPRPYWSYWHKNKLCHHPLPIKIPQWRHSLHHPRPEEEPDPCLPPPCQTQHSPRSLFLVPEYDKMLRRMPSLIGIFASSLHDGMHLNGAACVDPCTPPFSYFLRNM